MNMFRFATTILFPLVLLSACSSKTASVDSLSAEANTPAPTPNIGNSVNTDPNSCVDADGTFHADGSTWTVSRPEGSYFRCQAQEITLARMEVKTYKCQQGATSVIAHEIRPDTATANCPDVQLGGSLQNGELAISSGNTPSVSYTCTSEDGTVTASGTVAPGQTTLPINKEIDQTCKLTGTDGNGAPVTVAVEWDALCGYKIKVNGRCEDFACKRFETIMADASGVIQVPSRSAAGVCYAMAMSTAIPNSDSSLTGIQDMDVLSRNHDSDGFNNPSATNIRNPWLMSSMKANFKILGARTIKVAGSINSLAPILVDNFVLAGIYPMGTPSPAPVSYYRAYGTTDSAVAGTGSILLRNTPVAIQGFGSGGTSTVAPLDITTRVDLNKPYTIDLRALDCGGKRELSDLFLVFQ